MNHKRNTLILSLTAAAAVVALTAMPASGVAAPLPRVVEVFSSLPDQTLAATLSPGGETAYTINGDNLWLLDTDTTTATDSGIIWLAGTPSDVKTSPDGSRVYVASGTAVSFYNAQGVRTSNLVLPPGQSMTRLAPTADGVYLVTIGADNTARAINLTTNTYTEIAFGAPFTTTPTSLSSVAVTPSGQVLIAGTTAVGTELYLFGPGPTFTPEAEVQLSGSTLATPYMIAVNAAGTQALITTRTEQKAFVIGLSGAATPVVQGSIATSGDPSAVAYEPDGATAYIGTVGGVDVVDPLARTLLGTVPVGTGPVLALAVSPSGDLVYTGGSAPGDQFKLLSASSVTAPPTVADVNSPVHVAFVSAGFDLPVSYTLSPALPAGLSLDAATGVVSGVPQAALPQTTYTVTAQSSDGNDASTTWTLEVDAAAATAPPATSTPAAQASLADTGSTQPDPWLIGASAAAVIAGAALVAVARVRRSARNR